MRWPLPWPKSWRTEKPESDAVAEPEDVESQGDLGEEEPRSLMQSVLLFARDIGIALLVVVLVMGLLFAYTNKWPPMVVVESGSMQHSNTEGFIGVIDTGDLVLVQSVSAASDITTYVQGRVSGYETYGNYGDVIVFHTPSDVNNAQTPIIHRAMVYVERNSTGGFDVPTAAALPLGEWSGVEVNGTTANDPFHLRSFTLEGVRAWSSGVYGPQDLRFDGGNISTSGFLTHGDHNPPPFDRHGAVPVSKVLGKARGELPWFGLIKLTLARGESGCCLGWGDTTAPKNSWDALLVSLILLFVGPFALDYGWARYKDYRKAKRRRTRDEAEVDETPPLEPAPPVPDPQIRSASGPPGPEPDVTDEARTGSSELGDGDP